MLNLNMLNYIVLIILSSINLNAGCVGKCKMHNGKEICSYTLYRDPNSKYLKLNNPYLGTTEKKKSEVLKKGNLNE